MSAPPRTEAPYTAVVTGGTSGIGAKCVDAMVARARSGDASGAPSHIVIPCRDVDRARRDLEARWASGGAPRVEFAAIDLADLGTVKAFAAWLASTAEARPRVTKLVCCAGVQTRPALSKQGYEVTFAVNHLAHYLLIRLLEPLMARPARVVVVASGTHDPSKHTGVPAPRWRGRDLLRIDDTLAGKGVAGALAAAQVAYSTSKLCNVMCAYALSREYAAAGKDITVVACDPGLVPGTGLVRDLPAAVRVVASLLRFLVPLINLQQFSQTAAQAGSGVAALALDAEFARATGAYFQGTREIPSSPESRDADKQRELVGLSEEVVAGFL